MWSCGYVFPHEEASLRECAIPSYGSFVKRFAELAAELDVDMLRDYRHREVWGCKNLCPEMYSLISERKHI